MRANEPVIYPNERSFCVDRTHFLLLSGFPHRAGLQVVTVNEMIGNASQHFQLGLHLKKHC